MFVISMLTAHAYVRLQMSLGTWGSGIKWPTMCLDWMMVMKLNFGVWGTLLLVVMEAVMEHFSGLSY